MKTSLIGFMEKAIRLETCFSECYEMVIQLGEGQGVAKELRTLSYQETNHANILKTGKNFVIAEPDLFDRVTLTETEMDSGTGLAEALLRKIRGRVIEFKTAIGELHELEKLFERVHMDAAVIIKEPSLEHLFKNLSRQDGEHKKVLEQLIQINMPS
jgi:hypothetical protein